MTDRVTQSPSPPRRLLRSAGAILAGFLCVAVLSLGTDQIFHMLDVYPPWGEPMRDFGDNLLAFSYRSLYAVAGGTVTARLAPYAPMRHVLILGCIGTILSALGAYAADHHGHGLGLVSGRVGGDRAAAHLARRISRPTTDGGHTMTGATNDAAVRAALDAWVKATRAMDIDAIMACYARDAVSYDCHSAFQFRGADAHRKHLEVCFPYMRGPITVDLHEVSIASQGDLAFCHFTMHCGCTGQDGKEHWSWLRATSCLRSIGGQWLIVHDHCSAPFDPMSEKVMLDAGPDELKRARAA